MASVVGDLVGSQNILEIRDLGSDWWVGKVVADTSGTDLTTADEFGCFPIRASFEIQKETSETTKDTESKRKVTTSIDTSYKLLVTTMQNSLESNLDLPEALDGVIVLIIMELNAKPINGKYMYVLLIGEVVKSPGLKSGGTENQWEFRLQPAGADIDLTLSSALADSTATGYAATLGSTHLEIEQGKYVGRVAITA